MSKSWAKDIVDCLKIGLNPNDRIIKNNDQCSEPEELLIKSYFKMQTNTGKSLKALSS